MIHFLYSHWLSHHEGRGRIWALRMFVERGLFGYCLEDVWSMDCFLAKVLPPMLRELKGNGHPFDYSPDEWDKKLEMWAAEWANLGEVMGEVDMRVLSKSVKYVRQWWY